MHVGKCVDESDAGEFLYYSWKQTRLCELPKPALAAHFKGQHTDCMLCTCAPADPLRPSLGRPARPGQAIRDRGLQLGGPFSNTSDDDRIAVAVEERQTAYGGWLNARDPRENNQHCLRIASNRACGVSGGLEDITFTALTGASCLGW